MEKMIEKRRIRRIIIGERTYIMEMYQNLGKFLDNYGSPFFVGSLVEKKVLFVNKIAKEMFDCTEKTCDFEKIFDKTEERMESLIAKGLAEDKNTVVYNFIAITGKQEKIVVDLQFGFFNEEKTEMFLEILPRTDTRMTMALHQIHYSSRPEAILNLDEDLTILDYNTAFHRIFQRNSDMGQAVFRKQLSQAFHLEGRIQLLKEIHDCFKTNQIFTKDLSVVTSDGEEHWFCLELQKRELDNSGMKLMCSLVNIEKQVETEEKFDLVNQYLSVVQESTVDLLYRVDILTDTMYSYYHFDDITNDDKVIPDYVNTFFTKDTIHPDDKEIYLKGFRNFYDNDIPCEDPVRFSISGKPYQWYKITAKKIFDNEGNLKEVFGSLVNVDKEVNMEDEVSALNKYFDVLKNITDESLYFFDLKTRKLRLGGLTEKELGLPKEVENYPESVLGYVHPDDLELYKNFVGRALQKDDDRLEVRLKNIDGTYQWYELLSEIICDEKDNPTEIFGKIKNIQSKHELKEEFSQVNQYFTAMQTLSKNILFHIDIKTKTFRHSDPNAQGFGVPVEIPNYVETFIANQYILPEDADKYREYCSKLLTGENMEYDIKAAVSVGVYEWFHITSQFIYNKKGEAVEIFGMMENIHAKMTMKSEVSTLNKYFTAMQNLSENILFHVDVKTRTFKHASKYAESAGLPTEIPNFIDVFIQSGFIRPEDSEKYRECTEKLLSGENMEYEIQASVGAGVYEWFNNKSEFIYNEKGEPIEIFGVIENIQKQKDLEQKASHDLMTKVLNKVSFEEESEGIMLKVYPDKKHALIFIDLDDFKGVNDKLGHTYGDILLTTVGKRLKRHVREGDLVGRIGGDEFAVMLCNISDEQSVLERTNVMLESVKKNFSHEGISVGIRASVGVAVYPQHGENYKDLIGKSDFAVYESKRRGKNVVSMYTEELEEY